MSMLEKDGSQIWNYEFSGKSGSLEVREFEDNRCQKLKSSTKRSFKLTTKPKSDNLIQVSLEFNQSQPGQIASATYAFEKYGKNRMGLNAMYLVKQIGKAGRPETIINDENGFVKFPTQSYSRSLEP